MVQIEEMTERVRSHRCYSHPIFHHWREKNPDPQVIGALFHHIQYLCAASRPARKFDRGLEELSLTEERDILQRIVTSEEDHGPQLATMAGYIVNRAARENRLGDLGQQQRIEAWLKECSAHFFGRLPSYDRETGMLSQDRAVKAVFERRDQTDIESTYKNIGSLLAIEMLANGHIIPGEFHCLVDSRLYGIDINDPELEYLREHGGEDGGAEEWHEQEAIRAVGGVLNEKTEAAILAGVDECLDAIAALWDVLDSTLLN